MQSIEVKVRHQEGIHARPAAIFVKEATRFESEIHLRVGNMTVNGKSIMGLLMLALAPGTKVTIEVQGSDEATAITTLAKILRSKDQVIEK